MTKAAVTRLRYVINLLVAQAKPKVIGNPFTGKDYTFRINFVTLTLSSDQRGIDDKVIKKKMLDPFIRRMRDRHGLRSYVWRAERQKNGRIHFHITTDTYLPYDSITRNWNELQSQFHFISEFQERYPGTNPNSTDVHAVQNVEDLAAYLVKYMSKLDPNEQKISGKLWDCSKNLKTKERVSFAMGKAEFDLVQGLINTYGSLSDPGGYCCIIPIPKTEFAKVLKGSWYTAYQNFLDRVYYAADQRGRVYAEYD